MAVIQGVPKKDVQELPRKAPASRQLGKAGPEPSRFYLKGLTEQGWIIVSKELEIQLSEKATSSLDDASNALSPSGGRSNRDPGDVCLNDRYKVH